MQKSKLIKVVVYRTDTADDIVDKVLYAIPYKRSRKILVTHGSSGPRAHFLWQAVNPKNRGRKKIIELAKQFVEVVEKKN